MPEKLIDVFNSDELELFINGYPFIDLEDWRANTVYKGFNSNQEVFSMNLKIDNNNFLGYYEQNEPKRVIDNPSVLYWK